MKTLIALLISGTAALAECPSPANIQPELQQFIAEARAAPDPAAGQAASQKMWQVWLTAPDEIAQEALDSGMRKRESFDFRGAKEAFDVLVEYCPDYAEGYNQRAFVSYLSGDYDAALADLDITLAMMPNHVGAQSGRALTLMQMGRRDEARTQMLEALENNPWLNERALLAEGAPLGPVGEDI